MSTQKSKTDLKNKSKKFYVPQEYNIITPLPFRNQLALMCSIQALNAELNSRGIFLPIDNIEINDIEVNSGRGRRRISSEGERSSIHLRSELVGQHFPGGGKLMEAVGAFCPPPLKVGEKCMYCEPTT